MKKPTKQQKARAKARIAIAKDVIAQLKVKTYVAETGTYVSGLDTTPADEGKSVDMRAHLKRTLKPSKPCTVCALGSAFLSCVRVFDQFNLNQRTAEFGCVDYAAMRRKLREFFTVSELSAIESSFELNRMGTISFTQWDRVPYGYKNFICELTPKDRLVWLMNAIIRIGAGKVTLKALEQQALLSVVFDKEFEGRRWSVLFRA